MFKKVNEPEADLGSYTTAGEYQDVISYCLQQLRYYSAGTVLYILDCLYPGGITIENLYKIDLSQSHQHERLLGRDAHLRHDSYGELLELIKARTRSVTPKDYPEYWTELTRYWLLTCPIDPDYYLESDAGQELYCQRLRSELFERIMRID